MCTGHGQRPDLHRRQQERPAPGAAAGDARGRESARGPGQVRVDRGERAVQRERGARVRAADRRGGEVAEPERAVGRGQVRAHVRGRGGRGLHGEKNERRCR